MDYSNSWGSSSISHSRGTSIFSKAFPLYINRVNLVGKKQMLEGRDSTGHAWTVTPNKLDVQEILDFFQLQTQTSIGRYISRGYSSLVSPRPPPKGEYKLNFDAAFANGITHRRVVFRNDLGVVLGAWTNCFKSENSFCVETEAAVQALKIAQSLQLERVTFEGDALNVILAFSGVSDAEDWRARKLLSDGRNLMANHLFWFLIFSPRSGNTLAHNLASWAADSSFCGHVDLNSLPPSVLEGESTCLS